MAESIYTQLENQTAITPVDGKDYTVALPSGLFPTDKQFESESELVEWADENGFTAKLIQKGLQKAIIEVRACFKSCKKDKVWSEQMGIDNLDKLEWKTVDRPNTGGTKKVTDARMNDCMVMFGTLSQSGMDKKVIKASLIAVYGDDLVETIFNTLES